MTAAILPFPTRATVAHVPTPTARRLREHHLPLIRVAIEMLDQDEADLRRQTRRMQDAGAGGLLAELDDELRDAAADLVMLADACRMAADRLASMIESTAPS